MKKERYKPKKPTLYFINGCVLHKDFVVVSCGLLADPEAATSIMMFYDGSRWGGHKIPDDRIVSLAYAEETNTLYGLGKYGAVVTVDAVGKFSFDSARGRFIRGDLPDASEGTLTGIAVAGHRVFACGWSGMLYEQRQKSWQASVTGLPRQGKSDFLDICCVGDREVYAVGMNGVIFYFDGQYWHDLDSPTNEHLEVATPADDRMVYIAGKNGGVYKGDKDGWQFIGDPGVLSDFWGAREFHGKLFLAGGADDLYQHDGTSMSKVNMSIPYAVNTHRLDHRDDVLWSFGVDDLVKFDGQQWQYVTCSMNE